MVNFDAGVRTRDKRKVWGLENQGEYWVGFVQDSRANRGFLCRWNERGMLHDCGAPASLCPGDLDLENGEPNFVHSEENKPLEQWADKSLAAFTAGAALVLVVWLYVGW